jgi:hypothetical protein
MAVLDGHTVADLAADPGAMAPWLGHDRIVSKGASVRAPSRLAR